MKRNWIPWTCFPWKTKTYGWGGFELHTQEKNRQKPSCIMGINSIIPWELMKSNTTYFSEQVISWKLIPWKNNSIKHYWIWKIRNFVHVSINHFPLFQNPQESDIKWAHRWDTYLPISNDLIHWFSILNSLMVVLFLSGMVAVIMLRTLHRDISNYNQLETHEESQEKNRVEISSRRRF